MHWLVYATDVSPRLKYIFRFFAGELQADEPIFTSSREAFIAATGPRINYSPEHLADPELWISPQGLLSQRDIREQPILCFEQNGSKAFFQGPGDFGFDPFAAAFYLLSRYEEYHPGAADEYGRYDHRRSLAFREQFLDRPLVNYWVGMLGRLLSAKFPDIKLNPRPLSFLPTYDIDIAWSYLHKGWARNLGGFARALLRGNWGEIKRRTRVLLGKQKDPFDCFGWLNQLHEEHKLRPYYFFLVPRKRGRYDKNIDPRKEAMQYLIQDHVIRYPVGIHPSWKSGDDERQLRDEIAFLTRLNGSPILSSRQHYIRFTLPGGYRRLIDAGIRYDFSMGYGSINGFRASTSAAFYWYDLEKEEQTSLLLFPFCFMEANSYYEQKQTARQALDEMRKYYGEVKATGGYFIMIWHNSLLGTDPAFSGWREAYQQFITETGPAPV